MKRTAPVLIALNLLFWIMLVVHVIKAALIMISYVGNMISPPGAEDMEKDLSALFGYSAGHYSLVVLLMIALNLLKAWISWLAVKTVRVFKPETPFAPSITRRVAKLSRLIFATAFLALGASVYTKWLSQYVTVEVEWSSTPMILLAGVVYAFGYFFRKASGISKPNSFQ